MDHPTGRAGLLACLGEQAASGKTIAV